MKQRQRTAVARRGLALLLALFMALGSLSVSATDTVPEEWDVAISLMEHYNAGEPEVRVPASQELDDSALLICVSAMIPEKCSLCTGWVTSKGVKKSFRYYLKSKDGENEAAALQKAKELSAALVTPSMSRREILRAFHDEMILTTVYDTPVLATGMTADTVSSYSTAGPLLNGRAVCDGYSSAMIALCNTVGIPCYKIESQTMNHAWVGVFDEEGNLCFIDATYDDPMPDRPGVAGKDYFMLTAEQIIAKGHRFDTADQPGMTLEDYDRFARYATQRRGMSITEPKPTADKTAADALHTLGMFNGSDKGYELERTPTRNEMAVMLTRILGGEEEALKNPVIPPFTDCVPWAQPYIGYLYSRGLVSGQSPTAFGGSSPTGLRDYATVLLRCLGYSDKSGGDFTWSAADQMAKTLKLLDKTAPESGVFTRGTLAVMTVNVLRTSPKNGTEDYLAGLMKRAPVSPETLTEFHRLVDRLESI
ncbi:MAG: hypothetical protein RR828_02580 [Oscillospiraceae bacterium]